MPKIINSMVYIQNGKNFPDSLNRPGEIVTAESLVGYSKYTARKMEGKYTDEQMENSPGGYYSYTSKRCGSTRTYSSEGWLDRKEEMSGFRNGVAKYFQEEGTLAWMPVQSYRDYETAAQHGLFTEHDYAIITEKVLSGFFKKVGFEKDNMMWWMNYHTNKGHPHVHLVFLEKEQTRTRGMFTQKELTYFKGLIYKEMANRERTIDGTHGLLEEKFKTVESLKENVKTKASEIYEKNQDAAIIKNIATLYQKLPMKGRLQYGSSHMIPHREELDSIVDKLLSHGSVNEDVLALKSHWQEMDGKTSIALHENITKVGDSEIGKLKRQIANRILQGFKNEDLIQNITRSDALAIELENESSGGQDSKMQLNGVDEEQMSEPLALDEEMELATVDLDEKATDRSLEKNSKKDRESYSQHPLNVSWTKEYKLAQKHLYGTKSDKKNLVLALKLLGEESKNNNLLATHDMAKVVELMKEDGFESRASDLYHEALDGFTELFSNIEKRSEAGYSLTKDEEFLSKYLSYRIGKMYVYGQGTEIDYQKGISYLSVDSSNKFATYTLGTLYERGLGTEKDVAAAKDYYKLSADKGNPYGSYAYARLINKKSPLLSQRYTQTALDGFLQMLNKGGDDKLKYKIASIYIQGKLGHTDLDEGIKYLLEAIEYDNIHAMVLFVKTVEKHGLLEYQEQSNNIKEKLLDAKNETMIEYEGVRLTKSDDLSDVSRGIQYLQEIKDHHSNDILCYRLFNSFKKVGDFEQAVEYLKLSANLNNAYATYEYGKHFENLSKPKEAANYYSKSIEIMREEIKVGNNPYFFMNRLAYMYSKGQGTKIDISRSFDIYKLMMTECDAETLKSFRPSVPDSVARLGVIVERGWDNPDNTIQGTHLFRVAHEMGSQRASIDYTKSVLMNKSSHGTHREALSMLKDYESPEHDYWKAMLYLDRKSPFYNRKAAVKILRDCYNETGYEDAKTAIEGIRNQEKAERVWAKEASQSGKQSIASALKKIKAHKDTRLEQDLDLFFGNDKGGMQL